MPAASTTARTAPPAITPVPGAAGLSRTRPAPNSPITSCGMVVPFREILTRFFLASSMPLRIASGTSEALPRPKPTVPLPSPTTTRAANLKIRPPLTVLAYAVERYNVLGELVLTLIVSVKLSHVLPPPDLKLQAALTGAICELLHAAVVHIAAAVKHDSLNALSLAALGNDLTNLLGCFLVAAVLGEAPSLQSRRIRGLHRRHRQ